MLSKQEKLFRAKQYCNHIFFVNGASASFTSPSPSLFIFLPPTLPFLSLPIPTLPSSLFPPPPSLSLSLLAPPTHSLSSDRSRLRVCTPFSRGVLLLFPNDAEHNSHESLLVHEHRSLVGCMHCCLLSSVLSCNAISDHT